MSADEFNKKWDEEIDRLKKLAKMQWVLLLGAFFLGGWVATLELRERSNTTTNKKQTLILDELKEWVTSTRADRWTIRDHNNYVAAEAARSSKIWEATNRQNELQELRLQRLEDNQTRLQQTQTEFEKELKNLLKVTPADVLEELKKLTSEK